jgi:hypothetical protein
MDLRRKVIRLASENKALRPYLLPLLKKQAAEDTADFVLWALCTQSKIPTAKVIDFLERHGVPVVESTPPKKGLLQEGELVEIQVVSAKTAPLEVIEMLRPYDLQKGNIIKVDGMDATIKFQGGDVLTVPGGAMSGMSSGVYRTSQAEDTSKMKHIEIVYYAREDAPPPSNVQLQVLKEYVDRGVAKGEERNPNYFSGFVANIKINKEGHPYFMLWSQQRGGRPRTMSPEKGTVLYIGLVGRRPPGWRAELDAPS